MKAFTVSPVASFLLINRLLRVNAEECTPAAKHSERGHCLHRLSPWKKLLFTLGKYTFHLRQKFFSLKAKNIFPIDKNLFHHRHKHPSSWMQVSVVLDTSVCQTGHLCLSKGNRAVRVKAVKPERLPSPRGSSPAIAHLQGDAEGQVKRVNPLYNIKVEFTQW